MTLTENMINDNSRIYTKQIHVYNGIVYAEIIYQDKKTEYEYQSDLWYCSLHKSFGSIWNKSVKEKDLVNAHKWADNQLELLNKYATKKLSKAECIKLAERISKT